MVRGGLAPYRRLDLYVRVQERLALVGVSRPGEEVRSANLTAFALGNHLAQLDYIVAEAGFRGVGENLDFATCDTFLVNVSSHSSRHYLGTFALAAAGFLGHIVGENGMARRVVEMETDVAASGKRHRHARFELGLHRARPGVESRI